MKSRRIIFAACAALAVGLAIMAAPLGAKRAAHAPTPAAQTKKNIWLQAEVVHADAQSIVVREQSDMRMIHTFTYAPAVQAQMRAIIQQGGYRYGDTVKILHQQGQTVALEIQGKPSKRH
jgi:hypothetical protein